MRTKLYRFLVVIIVISFCVTPMNGLQSNVRAQGEIPPPPSPINGPTGGQVLAAPTVLSPSGPIETTNPTFTWTKDTSGLAYGLWLYQGSKLTYFLLLAPTTCGSSTCLYTPTKVLKAGSYIWYIEAYEAGGWTSYSYAFFTIALPFYSSFGSTSGWTALSGKWSKKKGSYTSLGLPNTIASSMHSGIYNNFTYEVRIMRTGCSSCANRLWFNGSPLPLNYNNDWNSGYLFQVSNQQYWSLWRLDSGVATALDTWTYAPSVVNTGWNILTVTFNAGTHMTQFFINYQLVDTWIMNTYTSGNVGVAFYRDSSAGNMFYVDYALLAGDAPASIVAGTSPGPEITPKYESDVVPGTGGDPNMAP
jgi:hypothetical protein